MENNLINTRKANLALMSKPYRKSIPLFKGKEKKKGRGKERRLLKNLN